MKNITKSIFHGQIMNGITLRLRQILIFASQDESQQEAAEEAEEEGDESKTDSQKEEQKEEGVAIEIELPKVDTAIGDDVYFVKLPNFLSIETKPFDPAYYEDEIDEDEVLDDEGRARLKLKVSNTAPLKL